MMCFLDVTNWTHHPDHDVRKPSNPDGGCEEGDHEPSLPAPLGTIGHSEEQKQGQRPHGQPLQLVTRPSCTQTERHDEGLSDSTVTNIYGQGSFHFKMPSGPYLEL